MEIINEGTNGVVYYTSKELIVKRVKRKGTGMNAINQAKLHELALRIVNDNEFKIIRVPKLVSYNESTIIMEKIDDSYPYYGEESTNNKPFCEELIIFYNEFKKNNYIPLDYECFLQKDGLVVILDFDKFISFKDELMYFRKEVNMQYILEGVFIPSYIANKVGSK